MSETRPFPHLKDTDKVRAEAAEQYGGLNDAAALQQVHKARMDPSNEAAALKRINVTETEKVKEDLDLAQAKIDDAFGGGTFTVLDAAVRGDALSTIVEDAEGRTHHKVVGWTDRWRPTGRKDTDAAANAEAEAKASKFGAEARAEIARQVGEATARIEAEVRGQLAAAIAKLSGSGSAPEPPPSAPKVRSAPKAVSTPPASAPADAGDGAPKVGEPGESAKTVVPDAKQEEVSYPGTHEGLDALAKKAGFEWPEGASKVADKQAALAEAEIKPEA